MGSKVRSIQKAMLEREKPPGVQPKEIRVTDWIDPDTEDNVTRRWQVLALLEWWEMKRRQNVWWRRWPRTLVHRLFAAVRLERYAPTWARRETDPLKVFWVLKYARDMELAGVAKRPPEGVEP